MVSIKEGLLNVFKSWVYETYSVSVIKIKDYILAWETGYYRETDDAGEEGEDWEDVKQGERRVERWLRARNLLAHTPGN